VLTVRIGTVGAGQGGAVCYRVSVQ
jgi:hypothetical protein